jgi:hypothetical protein
MAATRRPPPLRRVNPHGKDSYLSVPPWDFTIRVLPYVRLSHNMDRQGFAVSIRLMGLA